MLSRNTHVHALIFTYTQQHTHSQLERENMQRFTAALFTATQAHPQAFSQDKAHAGHKRTKRRPETQSHAHVHTCTCMHAPVPEVLGMQHSALLEGPLSHRNCERLVAGLHLTAHTSIAGTKAQHVQIQGRARGLAKLCSCSDAEDSRWALDVMTGRGTQRLRAAQGG